MLCLKSAVRVDKQEPFFLILTFHHKSGNSKESKKIGLPDEECLNWFPPHIFSYDYP